MLGHANAHDTLGHLYLLTGEMNNARVHAQESGRLARLVGVKRTTQRHEALLGLIDVWSGSVESGLAAVDCALAFAKRVDHIDVADYLGMCVDAYEAAGQSDRALTYLQELVAWKKKSIDAEVMPLQHGGLPESLQFQTGTSAFDDSLLVRAEFLHAGVRQRVQHLVETAINAEVASGHDLYRTFRVAKHTQYGAELLRKSKLRILDVAGTVAEQHHERYDGSGYPHGLSGKSIEEEARIVAVCDAFDAMTHRRPWRATPLSIQAALNKLKQGAGSQFDPRLVNAFVDVIRREFWEHDDFDAFLAEGADEHEYVRVRARMEALIADGR